LNINLNRIKNINEALLYSTFWFFLYNELMNLFNFSKIFIIYHFFNIIKKGLKSMKAKNYRNIERPYTRKEFIHGAPQPRISKYTMGTYKNDYEYLLQLISKNDLQIRDVALESARVTMGKILSKKLGENYFLELKAHPHHVLRENKMIFGAHADRLQEGMRRAFGKPIGIAARVKKGESVFDLRVYSSGLEAAKEALKLGSKKLPKDYAIKITKIAPLQTTAEIQQ